MAEEAISWADAKQRGWPHIWYGEFTPCGWDKPRFLGGECVLASDYQPGCSEGLLRRYTVWSKCEHESIPVFLCDGCARHWVDGAAEDRDDEWQGVVVERDESFVQPGDKWVKISEREAALPAAVRNHRTAQPALDAAEIRAKAGALALEHMAEEDFFETQGGLGPCLMPPLMPQRTERVHGHQKFRAGEVVKVSVADPWGRDDPDTTYTAVEVEEIFARVRSSTKPQYS
jgi:hypothetical protein